MHNIMLVDMIDTLQDLTNAMARKIEKGTNMEKDVSGCTYDHKTSLIFDIHLSCFSILIKSSGVVTQLMHLIATYFA